MPRNWRIASRFAARTVSQSRKLTDQKKTHLEDLLLSRFFWYLELLGLPGFLHLLVNPIESLGDCEKVEMSEISLLEPRRYSPIAGGYAHRRQRSWPDPQTREL